MGPPVIQKAVARTQDCQKLAILDCEDVRTPAELHDIQVWARLVQERSVLVKLVGVCYAEARTLDEVVETVQRRHDPKCLVPKVFPQPGFPEPNLLEPRLLASSSPQPDSSQPDSSEPVEPACKQRRLVDRINRGFTRTWLREEMEDYRSFAWYCDTAGYQASLEQHVENMNSFRFLFEPHYRANLKKPGVEFCILQEFNTHSKEPVWCCVGKVLTRVLKNCRVTSPYLLPRRPILGPTTLDTDASFIMCNLAEVKAGDVVLDPFCGTGSILIAASRLGAVCFGSDLDKRVVRGWGVAYLNRA
ncbi:putative methyltransferase, partial [Gregarina niphandrodes]